MKKMDHNTGSVGFSTRDARSTDDSFDGWVEEVKDRVSHNSAWDRIGLWLYPTKKNTAWSEVFFHVCEGAQESTEVIPINKPCMCGESMPEGFRMIALLELL